MTSDTVSDNWSLWSNLSTAILCVAIISFLGPMVSRWYKRYKFFRSLPSPPYSPLFGNMHLLPKDGEGQIALMTKSMEELHPKLSVFWMTPITPHLIVYHPDTVRPVFMSPASLKPRGWGEGYEFGVPWIGEGLVTANGDTWARSRKLLNPSFHADILRNYMTVFNECTSTLIGKLDELADTGDSFDVFPLITKCTLEVVLRCIVGYDADIQSYNDGHHPYAKAVLGLTDAWAKRIWNPLLYFDCLYKRTAAGKKFAEDCDLVHKIGDDIIEKRRKLMETNGIPQSNKMSFIDALLSAKDEDGHPMTPLEIRYQVDTFIFAGHDTTSTNLSFNLYNLAKHQEYQRKVQEEVDGVLEGRDFEDVLWEDLPKFKWLSLCSKESLRLYPPVPILGRMLGKDLDLDGVTIPSGTIVHVGNIYMHRNSKVWDRPNEYVPERFLEETPSTKLAFTPFAVGPRNCIGQNFSLHEERVLLSRILKRYNIQLSPGYEAPKRQMGTVLKSHNGIQLTLKRR